MESETPVDVVEGETPVEIVEGETPVEVVEGETPVEVVEGETPVEIVEGETPVDVVEGETPVDVVEGETPIEVVEGETPVDTSDSDFTAQDLELGKNATNDILTNESSSSDVVETSNTNSEIETPDSLDSEPTNTESEITEVESTNTESEITEVEPTNTESEITEVEPANTDSEVAEGEVVTPDQEEVSVETDATETSEAQDVEESTESSEIVEELLEEAEIREAKNSQDEVAEEVETEEVSQDEVAEEVETEEVSQGEVAEEVETEEVSQDEIDEETEIEEASQEEEEVAEEKSPEPDLGQLDRVAYETQFQEAPNDLAILMQEEFQLTELIGSSGLELYGTIPSVKDISHRLAQLAEQTGKKPAFINISLQSNQLESFVVLPEQTLADAKDSVVASSELNSIDSPQPQALTVRKTVKDTSRKDLLATATHFREEVSDIRKLGQASYMASAQELYEVLIKPIEAELEANDIDILVFSMDSGLRLLPVAALHDGEQFLVEKYAMGIVPSFGLTDTRYVSPEQSSILAMGASEFEEQNALPTMPIELSTIVGTPRQGELFLNEQFTIPNFVAQNSRETAFSIIHLGTHAEFKAGNRNDSYIQFYDDKLKIPQLQELSDQLGWNTNNTPIELLVLSACETALGDNEAELGFAGLAVQAGVKSALASLWYVSDLGTLALMGEFYDQLGTTLIKAEALRQTQLEMLRGNVKVDEKQVRLSNGADLPLPEDFPNGTLALSHPYFWSSFTLIGNWN